MGPQLRKYCPLVDESGKTTWGLVANSNPKQVTTAAKRKNEVKYLNKKIAYLIPKVTHMCLVFCFYICLILILLLVVVVVESEHHH